jgi:hypothetical protein
MTTATSSFRDPFTERLLDAAEGLLGALLFAFWRPEDIAALPGVWQWRKLDFLDWLRPLEKLLRRIVLTEAFHLALSQTLPAQTLPAAGLARPTRRSPVPVSTATEPDPERPESWPASFRVLGREPKPRRRRSTRRPPSDPHFPEKPRFRRKLHDPKPLALRLEAVMRVMANPAPFIRRVAFRLRRATRQSLALALFTPDGRKRLVTEALHLARERASAMAGAWWGSG